MDFKNALERVLADPRYQKNIEYGKPRRGHPEGTVKQHLEDLENNLAQLTKRLPNEEAYWKLKFLIHVHDTFKAEAHGEGGERKSQAMLARIFASEFIEDADILNMIQYHDENYALWKQVNKKGHYDQERFQALLNSIQDWDLFLIFTIIDGHTPGKELGKLVWFIQEIRQHRETQVDETWLDLA